MCCTLGWSVEDWTGLGGVGLGGAGHHEKPANMRAGVNSARYSDYKTRNIYFIIHEF